MTVLARPRVEVFFDLSTAGGDFFTLDDPVKGELDNTDFLLSGDLALDITDDVVELTINRGRSFELNEISAGSLSVQIDNQDGDYWPSPLGNEARFGSGNIVPGKRVRVSVGASPVFDGFIEDWDFDYRSDGELTASFVGSDAFARLANRQFTAFTGTAGQLTGERIDAVLSRSEVNFPPNRSIDVGRSTLQADTVDAGTNVLAYCQLLAQAEVGRLFVGRDGVLTFQDRWGLVNPDPAVTFSDDCSDGEIRFESIDVVYGSELLYNRVTVERQGGSPQLAVNNQSVDKYGARALRVTGLPLEFDSIAGDIAAFLLSQYREPDLRVAALSVVLDGLSAVERADVVKLDIGSAVSVEWSPPGGETVTQLSVVEGVRHQVSSTGLYRFELSLSPLSSAGVFVLDDSTFGRLDSGGVLAF